MKRLIALAVTLLLGFYAIWPMWTGYRIKIAFDTDNAPLLESKVDFPSVRQSLKPAVTEELQRQIEQVAKEAGALGGLLLTQLKGEFLGKLADATIETVVTPTAVVRAVREGRDLRQTIERAMAEQMGRGPAGGDGTAAGRPTLPGGLGGLAERFRKPSAGGETAQAPTVPEPPKEASTPLPKRPPLGLSNIKKFSFEGPLAFSVGVARDAQATEPDVIAHLRFTGTDWKVVGLTPRPLARRTN